MTGQPPRNEWPLAALLIAIIAAVTVLCVVGPAPVWGIK